LPGWHFWMPSAAPLIQWNRDYGRRFCNRETWATIEAFLLWCKQKWKDEEKGGSSDAEKAFLSSINYSLLLFSIIMTLRKKKRLKFDSLGACCRRAAFNPRSLFFFFEIQCDYDLFLSSTILTHNSIFLFQNLARSLKYISAYISKKPKEGTRQETRYQNPTTVKKFN